MNMHAATNQGDSSQRRIAITLIAQFIGALSAGAGMAYLGSVIGFRFFAGDPAGFGDIIARLGGILIGYPIGGALGAWLMARWLGGRGPFWTALLGAIAAIGLVLLSFRLFAPGALVIGWLLVFLCGALGAVGGLWLGAKRFRPAE